MTNLLHSRISKGQGAYGIIIIDVINPRQMPYPTQSYYSQVLWLEVNRGYSIVEAGTIPPNLRPLDSQANFWAHAELAVDAENLYAVPRGTDIEIAPANAALNRYDLPAGKALYVKIDQLNNTVEIFQAP